MLRKITRAEVEKMIRGLDVRSQEFTTEDMDYVMDMGYAELATITHAFYNEEVVSMVPYYDAGESNLTLDIEEDVAFIYDLYLTMENQTDLTQYMHGIAKITDENAVYKDGRYVGRVHVNLDRVNVDRFGETIVNRNVDNCVIKYCFTPTHTSEDIYVDQPTLLAMRDAFGCSLYNKLNDVDRESQKRASLQRTALAIVPEYPNDYRIPENSNVPREGRIMIRKVFGAGA